MLSSRTILVVDNNSYLAIDLCDAIEHCEGVAAGPVSTVSETRSVVDNFEIAGAVVDYDLAEASAVVAELADRDIPVVGHSNLGPAPANGKGNVLVRPILPRDLLDLLLFEMGKADAESSPMLAKRTKKD